MIYHIYVMFELEIVFDFIHKNVTSVNLKTCITNCPGDNLAQILINDPSFRYSDFFNTFFTIFFSIRLSDPGICGLR